MKDIEFYYDFGSPNAYFVHKVMPGIAEEHGVKIVYKPMLLGGVFKATNNQPPMMAFSGVTHKLDYMRVEIGRFVKRYKVPFKFNPHFPVITVMAMRGATYAQRKPWEHQYIDTVMDALWLHEKKMDDAAVMEAVLDDAGLPGGEIMQAIQSDSVKKDLMDLTADAVDRKIFGAPTMFVGDEMFFGKDSLDDLDWYLGQTG